jgi:hypothetical protein
MIGVVQPKEMASATSASSAPHSGISVMIVVTVNPSRSDVSFQFRFRPTGSAVLCSVDACSPGWLPDRSDRSFP